MTSGHIFMLLGLFSFGVLGVFHKLADVKSADPKALTAMLYSSSVLFVFLTLITTHQKPIAAASILLIAISFGISAGVAILAFQAGIRFGNITTSWLVINLSSAIPTVLSIVIYKETVTPVKAVALLLIPIAIGLLWKERVNSPEKRVRS